MDPAPAPASDVPVLAFEDGLGRRYRVRSGGNVEAYPEILCFRHELTDIPSFEFALRERVARLSGFQHACYARVRRVERLSDGQGTLALVSECAPGVRLSEILTNVEKRHLVLDTNAALCLVRQLVPAVAVLHQNAHVPHGAIGPERLIVTPHARLFITEFVLGPALEQLHYSRDRYWKDLRVAMPQSAGLPRFDEYADVAQLGITALSLILGRLIRAEEYPTSVDALVASTASRSSNGYLEPLPSGLKNWLRRCLQLDPRSSFRSPLEAQASFEELLAEEGAFAADTVSLETFMAMYARSSDLPVTSLAASVMEAAHRPEPVAETPLTIVQQPLAQPAFEPVHQPLAQPARGFVSDPYGYDQAADLPDPASTLFENARPVAAPVPEVPPPPVRAYEPVEFKPDPFPGYSSGLTSQIEDNRPTEPSRGNTDDYEEPEDDFVAPKTSTKRRFSVRSVMVAGLAVVAIAGAGLGIQRYLGNAKVSAASGILSVNTNPPGAAVTIDGQARGQTPLSLSLAPGAHVLVVQGTGEPRQIPVTITEGAVSSQYLELPVPAAATGSLQISTEPNGARVTVDGQAKGVTPLSLSDLSVGQHVVTLENDLGSVDHTVTIEPGQPTSLVVPLASAKGAAPASGWMSVTASLEMQLYEQGRLLGTSGIDRLMVPSGRHDIEIVNEVIGYRAVRSIQVAPGKVSSISVELPKGTVSLNAVPWATVTMDGESIGETPIGNLAVQAGPHEFVFRNPQFGEQRRAITVNLREPARLSVDMTKR